MVVARAVSEELVVPSLLRLHVGLYLLHRRLQIPLGCRASVFLHLLKEHELRIGGNPQVVRIPHELGALVLVDLGSLDSNPIEIVALPPRRLILGRALSWTELVPITEYELLIDDRIQQIVYSHPYEREEIP